MNPEETIFIDLETTGINIFNDRVCQVGAILPGGEEFNQLVNPCIPIPKDATGIHGITDDMVKDAPNFNEIGDKLISELEKAKYFVAYNSIFDFQFLQAELYRTHNYFLAEKDYTFIDPYKIFKKMFQQNLSNAYWFYTGKEFTEAHSAIADIKATKEVLERQQEKYPELFSKSPEEVAKLTIGDTSILGRWFEIKNDDFYFKQGKHKGQKITSKHYDYLKWVGGLPDITISERRYIEDILSISGMG